MRMLTIGIILVALSGCCSSGGIQGAIDYQKNECTGGYAYAPAGYIHAPVSVTVEPTLEQKQSTLNITNALQSQSEAIRAAEWRAENMPE